MIRRAKADWLLLFKQHQESGLSASAFCRENNLCTRYFSKRKKELFNPSEKPKTTRFIKAKLKPKDTPDAVITLQHHQTHLRLPASISPSWLAELIKALV